MKSSVAVLILTQSIKVQVHGRFLSMKSENTLVQNCNKQKHIMENYSNKRENSELKRGIEIGFSTYVTVASLIADTLFLGSKFRVYMLISPRSEESKNSFWVVIQSEIFFWVIYFNYMILKLLVSCEIKYIKWNLWNPRNGNPLVLGIKRKLQKFYSEIYFLQCPHPLNFNRWTSCYFLWQIKNIISMKK